MIMVIPRRKGTCKVLRRRRSELLDQRGSYLLELASHPAVGRLRGSMTWIMWQRTYKLKKRIISLSIAIMFIVSVFWAEADSVRAFSDNNRFGGKAGLSYSTEKEFVYPAMPDQKNLRVSSRADSLIISSRRMSSPAFLICGGDIGSYRDFPDGVRFADDLHVL